MKCLGRMERGGTIFDSGVCRLGGYYAVLSNVPSGIVFERV